MSPPELIQDSELSKSTVVEDRDTRRMEAFYGDLQQQDSEPRSQEGMRLVSQWINGVDLPIFGVDANSVIRAWNAKTEELTGYSIDQVWNCNIDSLVTPGTLGPLRRSLQEALKGREAEPCVVDFRTADGSRTCHVRIQVSAQRDQDGNILGALCFASRESNGCTNGDGSCDRSPMNSEVWLLLDTANAPIFGIDVNGKVNLWNDKAVVFTGYSKDEVMHKPLVSILPSFRESGMAVLERALTGTETSNHHLEFRTKHGEIRFLLLNTTTRRDVHGTIVGVVAIAQDVTNETHRERSLEARAREMRLMVDTANAPIFGVDIHGMINEWNGKTVEITGYTSDEALQRPFLETFIDPQLRESVQGVLDNALAGQGSSNYELEFRTKFNDTRYLLLNATTRLDAENNIVGVIFVAQDVTESAKHDRAVTAMANELRQLIDDANAPIFGIDIDGDVNEWNDKTAEITGYTKEEAFDRPLVETFILPSLRQSVQEVLDNALLGKETSNYELEIRTKSNETRYLLLNATTRRDTSDNIIGVLGVAQDVTEAAQHERAVAAMARELRQLIDTANAPIFGIDVNGNVNEWNEKTAEITGFSGDEAFNQPLVETFIVPKLRASVQDVLDNALRGRGTSNYELEIRTKSNEIRYLLVNATTRRDIENNIVGVVGVAQDVTEAAKHDRAVAAMANELRQLIDTANAPIFGIDVDGDVNEWNDKTAEITGYTKEEAFDCPLVETFIVPSLRHSVQEVMNNALRGRGTQNYELEFRTKSNEIRHLLVNATTRRDGENNIVGVVGVAQDVTEAVQRDTAVAGMANELRQLIDSANAPIFGIDADGNVNEWNIKTAEITGYSKEEAFDEPLVSKFIVPSMRKSIHEVLTKALRGEETSNYELEFETKSGETRYLLVNATTRRDPDNNVVGGELYLRPSSCATCLYHNFLTRCFPVVGVAQDVTDDRKHAQELREMQYYRASQEAKVETERNMTAYFAHELRNPLGAIDSALTAMPDELPPSAKSLVTAMQLCTGFMSSIMNNLLDVRKMEEGKMTLNSVPISLESLLDSVHKMLLPSVRPNVAFLTRCDTGGKDWVLGDAHRIQQVMTNVITNAIKYTTSGSITLSIEWEGENVKFECADTGPGIPKNEQKKLFERFVQRGGAPGTGLGLAIAKHLVDLTGGSIWFESDPSVRPGTSCIVVMPLPVSSPPESQANDEEHGLIEEPLKFLIVDDVKMNRMLLKRRIKKGIAPNAKITESSTGEDALILCGTEQFDVIVVDQYMEESGGVMVGTDVVFAMRRIGIQSIIIGCSGNDMDDQFAEAGADWVWKKPMPSNAKIISHIREALETRAIL